MIEFGKPDHIAATTAAVAVEEILVGIQQKAGLVISMEWARSHAPTTTKRFRWPPTECLEIVQQRNLPFQCIEVLTIHGLLASTGRIRQSDPRSQATMVGAFRKNLPNVLLFSQQPTLSRRRSAHRRTVDESGRRDESLQCGVACSNGWPSASRSHACCRQCKVKCADGTSQWGRIVKVLRQGRHIPRRTHIRS
jgi:hypothetical protein